MKTVLILTGIIGVTLVGDYLIKLASQRPGGLTSVTFAVGALLYALPAIGWFYLMRSHSLAAIWCLLFLGDNHHPCRTRIFRL